jgi:hypothetical protein
MNGVHKEQPPLRLPNRSYSYSVRAAVSPRFDNILHRSRIGAWSPVPFTGSQVTRETEIHPSSRKYNKANDTNSLHRSESRMSEIWTSSQLQRTPGDAYLTSTQTKTLQKWQRAPSPPRMIESIPTRSASSNIPIWKRSCHILVMNQSPKHLFSF